METTFLIRDGDHRDVLAIAQLLREIGYFEHVNIQAPNETESEIDLDIP